jgi:hypothetical protein
MKNENYKFIKKNNQLLILWIYDDPDGLFGDLDRQIGPKIDYEYEKTPPEYFSPGKDEYIIKTFCILQLCKNSIPEEHLDTPIENLPWQVTTTDEEYKLVSEEYIFEFEYKFTDPIWGGRAVSFYKGHPYADMNLTETLKHYTLYNYIKLEMGEEQFYEMIYTKIAEDPVLGKKLEEIWDK